MTRPPLLLRQDRICPGAQPQAGPARREGCTYDEEEEQMSQVSLSDGRLTVRLRPWERIAGLLGDLDVPLTSVSAAEAVPDGTRALQGVRAPGLAWPGGPRIGTWRGRGATRYVALRPHEPALRLQLRGERYDEVLVSTPEAARLAGALAAQSP